MELTLHFKFNIICILIEFLLAFCFTSYCILFYAQSTYNREKREKKCAEDSVAVLRHHKPEIHESQRTREPQTKRTTRTRESPETRLFLFPVLIVVEM